MSFSGGDPDNSLHVLRLGHVEIAVPDVDSSVTFLTRVLGLQLSEINGGIAYLRAWQDYEHHTLVLRPGSSAALVAVAWRVLNEPTLANFEQRLRQLGTAYEWLPEGQEKAQGKALRFRGPDGLPLELYAAMERFVPSDPQLRSKMPSHTQRYPAHLAAPRRLDHVAFWVRDVEASQEWFTRELGLRPRYYEQDHEGLRIASFLSRTCVSHELALLRNRAPQGGALLHHVGFEVDGVEQLTRTATLCTEWGYQVEWGPIQHGNSDSISLYVLDPSGLRVELRTRGILILDPDWEPQEWTGEAALLSMNVWGTPPPESFRRHAVPLA